MLPTGPHALITGHSWFLGGFRVEVLGHPSGPGPADVKVPLHTPKDVIFFFFLGVHISHQTWG